ncbi:MAG: putative glutamine amidotransferase [Planctomycetota bacterium]|jgi:predicted glutamine amidotransferase
MCELLGVSSLHPVTLEMSFQQLIKRAKIFNPDGWGAVFYEQNDAYVFREPRPADNSTLARLLANSGIESTLILCHIRRATTGPVGLRNTHPFNREVDGRQNSFAFNGNIPEVFELDLSMERFTPVGETDGEYAFCCLLEQLNQPPGGASQSGKASILQAFGDRLAAMGPANFLYSDSRRLYAYASRRTHSDGVHPPGLYYNIRHCDEVDRAIPCVGVQLETKESSEQLLTLVASVPLSDGEWVPFQDKQLIIIEDGNILS